MKTFIWMALLGVAIFLCLFPIMGKLAWVPIVVSAIYVGLIALIVRK